MKKVFLLLLVTCSLSITSCSKDDNGPSAAEIAEATDSHGNSIIGAWLMTHTEDTEDQESETITTSIEINFDADKTGTYFFAKTGQEDVNIEFDWIRSGDEYTVTGEDLEDDGIFTIGDSEGTMALLEDGEVIALKED